ncbi:unnamed protein product [Closterium sp. NIES-64]|nr:unnamed protein product [Closterium sp. NIES-64]
MIASEMAGRKSNDPPPPAENERQATQLGTLLKQFVRVAAPYWSSEDKGQARLRLAAVFVFALGCTGVSVLFNFLYRDFYNAIASKDGKDEEAFLRQLLWFLGATVGGVPVGAVQQGGVPVFVFRDYLRDTLALRWRAWMTTDLLNKYFQHRTFYNIQSQVSFRDRQPRPDQSINEDVDEFTTTLLTFSLYSLYPPPLRSLPTVPNSNPGQQINEDVNDLTTRLTHFCLFLRPSPLHPPFAHSPPCPQSLIDNPNQCINAGVDDFTTTSLTFSLAHSYHSPFCHSPRFQLVSQSLIDYPDQQINDDVDDFTTTPPAFSTSPSLLSSAHPFVPNNPDQRINDDVDDFTTTSLTFSLALVNAIVDLISFSGILYSIYPRRSSPCCSPIL